jgi:predicted nucleic-acid-binding Zn-ribbon protein
MCCCKETKIESWKAEVATQLKEKVHGLCDRCGNTEFEVLGQTLIPLNEDINVIILKCPQVPCAMIACSNCGYIMLHALCQLDIKPMGAE